MKLHIIQNEDAEHTIGAISLKYICNSNSNIVIIHLTGSNTSQLFISLLLR